MLLAAPEMTAGHFLFSAGLSAYVWIGVTLEERALLATFGDDYRRYQREVPKLLPWPRP
jgi:protein-S-isoprenylcysteine O-methyltransferase Ste14